MGKKSGSTKASTMQAGTGPAIYGVDTHDFADAESNSALVHEMKITANVRKMQEKVEKVLGE